MDPLSITAGTIAVIGVVGQAAKCVQRLRAIRQAPAEVKFLLEEVTDLGELLQQIEAAQKPSNASATTRTIRGLDWQIERASTKLRELDSLLHKQAIRTTRFGVDRGPWKWLHARERANALREELKVLRLNLAASLGASTSTAVDRVESAIERVNTSQADTVKLLNTLISTLAPKLPSSPPAFDLATSATTDLSIDFSVEAVADEHFGHAKCENYQEMTRHGTKAAVKAPQPKPSLQIYGNKSIMHCSAWCSCTCHRKNVLRVKQAFTKAIGSSSLAYSGLPWVTAGCDEKSCNSRSIPSVTMNIQFPAWFWKRYLSASFTHVPIRGPEINIKLPRTVDWTWKLWKYAPNGNLRAIQDIFAAGAASPWDVSPFGGSALHYAADHRQFEVCRFLVDQGALTGQEDTFHKSPTELAWGHILSGTLNKEEEQTVAGIFNDPEYLQSRQFTVLHKIVLGLISKDLRLELQCSTKEIDAIDSSGRTCVSWAAARGDDENLQTLLEHGADPNLPDIQGSTPLHHVRDSKCCNLLLSHGSNVTSQNSYGHTALHTVTRGRGSLPLLDTLVKAGIDVNTTDHAGETALCNGTVAIEQHVGCALYLLNNGADPEIGNGTKDTLMHLATMNDSHPILDLLFKRGVDYTSKNIYGQTILHLAARLADSKTVSIFKQYGIERIDKSTLDHLGKSARDYLDEREEDSVNPDFRSSFEDLLQSIESSETKMAAPTTPTEVFNIKKEPTVTCNTPVSAYGDCEYDHLLQDLEHDSSIFYDAVEHPFQALTIEIAI